MGLVALRCIPRGDESQEPRERLLGLTGTLGTLGEGRASGLRVRVLVTPSCLGDRQERGLGASRWQGRRQGVFAQSWAPARGRGGSWSQAKG